jgi:benzodiazapine receptor
MKIKWPEMVLSLIICFAAAAIGSAFTAPAIPVWYAGLAKPVFNPPNWLFGPVWTLLYFLMAVSLYLVRITPVKNNPHRAEILFYTQLFLNVLWSVIFFGLKNLLAAYLEIILLLIALLLTWQKFREISKTAANLLLPYIAWVTFAALLNLSVVFLN